jgi:hypothetical protein
MFNHNFRTGLKLIVTHRPNARSPNGWTYVRLDDILNLIAHNKEVKRLTEEIQTEFVEREGLYSESGEPQGDEFITPKFLQEPHKEQYHLRKLDLAIVNYFGEFVPLGTKLILKGEGTGLVTLDVDCKLLGAAIPEPYLEVLEEALIQYFIKHLCTVALYRTSSGLGYHLIYQTDAKTPIEYKVVFHQLVRDLKENCPKVARLVDEGVDDYTRGFFLSHSPIVYSKEPDAIYLTNREEVLRLEQTPTQQLSVTDEDVSYDAFPYQADIRLFLAYHNRKEGPYFHGR